MARSFINRTIYIHMINRCLSLCGAHGWVKMPQGASRTHCPWVRNLCSKESDNGPFWYLPFQIITLLSMEEKNLFLGQACI